MNAHVCQTYMVSDNIYHLINLQFPLFTSTSCVCRMCVSVHVYECLNPYLEDSGQPECPPSLSILFETRSLTVWGCVPQLAGPGTTGESLWAFHWTTGPFGLQMLVVTASFKCILRIWTQVLMHKKPCTHWTIFPGSIILFYSYKILLSHSLWHFMTPSHTLENLNT